MTDFVSLPKVLSQDERERARKAFGKATQAQAGMEADAQVVADAGRYGNLVIDAYGALLARVRLAELALYRARLLADDQDAIITLGGKQRAGPPKPEGIANMTRKYVEAYVDPVIEPLREALGFTPGAEREGWYLAPEDARAKLIGNVRAQERLEREGRRGLP